MRLTVVTMLLATAVPALAQLEEADDPVYGTDALTIDTVQDLAFLDPIHTFGMSYAEIADALGADGAFEGFRRATVEEVAALFNNGGFTPALFPPYDDPFGLVIFPSGQPAGALADLQDLFGVTLSADGGQTFTTAYTSTESVNFPGARLLVSLGVLRDGGFGIDFASVTPLEEVRPDGDADSAHWLIRVEQPFPPCEADLNGSGAVDIVDFTAFSEAFGSSEGDPNWNEAADLNGSGAVDIVDFQRFSVQFGDTTETCNSR